MTVTDPRTGREKTIPLGTGYGHSAADLLSELRRVEEQHDDRAAVERRGVGNIFRRASGQYGEAIPRSCLELR
jgi:hypothetical protein